MSSRIVTGEGPSPTKARRILRDKEVRGKPITKKQRGLFGAIASGNARKGKRRGK